MEKAIILLLVFGCLFGCIHLAVTDREERQKINREMDSYIEEERRKIRDRHDKSMKLTQFIEALMVHHRMYDQWVHNLEMGLYDSGDDKDILKTAASINTGYSNIMKQYSEFHGSKEFLEIHCKMVRLHELIYKRKERNLEKKYQELERKFGMVEVREKDSNAPDLYNLID